jgi:hypothetical protein
MEVEGVVINRTLHMHSVTEVLQKCYSGVTAACSWFNCLACCSSERINCDETRVLQGCCRGVAEVLDGR